MQRLQLEQQITNLSNARSLYMDRQAEAATRQAQLQMMGTPLSPQLAQSIGHPELAGQVVPPSLAPVISAEDRGREAAQIAADQRAEALKQNTPDSSDAARSENGRPVRHPVSVCRKESQRSRLAID